MRNPNQQEVIGAIFEGISRAQADYKSSYLSDICCKE